MVFCGRRGTRAALAVALWLGGWAAGQAEAQAAAEQVAQSVPQTAEDALRVLSDAAGLIFTGTVEKVRRPQLADGSAGGMVETVFTVTDAIRGVAGPEFTLREWAGLWPAGDEPFRPGQRYLMLLHAANSAGLSSPVGGPDGAIPIHGLGGAVGSEGADLGWIATRAVTPVVYRGPHAGPVHASGGDAEVHASAPPDGYVGSLRKPVAYGAVVNVLRTWERGRYDTR